MIPIQGSLKKATDVDYQIAELLIENVINVNHKDQDDQEPLSLLSFSIAFNFETDRETNPDYDLIECIVNKGADVNAVNAVKKTALTQV